jgi:acyl-homoserine-lactone acylase
MAGSLALRAAWTLTMVREIRVVPSPSADSMNKLASLVVLALVACSAHTSPAGPVGSSDLMRWRAQAARVTITRDDWGIAHVHGASDADAVFGMVFAQAEDDFNRVETNYVTALGRLAESDGEKAIWQDLRYRLFVDPDTLKAQYARSPRWLVALMDAWADGLNYYLATHPAVTPRVIRRFEPWMALSFTEGSIGGDIEAVSLRELERFYGSRTTGQTTPRVLHVAARDVATTDAERDPSGSNGFAIAPSNTVAKRALLWINPHTTFFFRSELQMTSDAGLNAYGAATWGQPFVYQGFNDRVGWMHPTSGADVVDEFAESVTERDGRRSYRYAGDERPVVTQRIDLRYRTPGGGMATRSFTVYRTHHGPIVREADGHWIAVAMMQKPIEALSQSFLRTKARSLAEYRKAMELHANSTNNTVYADADGNIAFFMPQFVPKRDDRFDRRSPVDGSDPATEWRGVHAVEETPHVVNPANGWVANTNNWPYSVAGASSPKATDFPRYMDAAGENPRGEHAALVLGNRRDFTPQRLIDAGFDPYMPALARLVPTLVAAWDAAPPSSATRARLAEPIAALRAWDFRWSATSVPTTVAVLWATDLWNRNGGAAAAARMTIADYVQTRAPASEKLDVLAGVVDRLERDFGGWRVPWGDVNRVQRITSDLAQPFSDAAPSLPVPFTSSAWGSLASLGARTYPGTRRRYGTSGNTFVAVVEFGDSVRARAISPGGESGDPRSPHFNDQMERYTRGDLRTVYFYPSQLVGHTERRYRPGE